jgi:hypothetical protein
VKIAAFSLEELASLPFDQLQRFSAILVNYVRFETARSSLPPGFTRLFPIRLRLSDRVVRRMRRLPAQSRILLLFSQADVDRMGRLVIDIHTTTVGRNWTFECRALESIEDLGVLADTGRYRLIIVSIHVWEKISERARRRSNVACSQYVPEVQSLEEIRLKAGVLA